MTWPQEPTQPGRGDGQRWLIVTLVAVVVVLVGVLAFVLGSNSGGDGDGDGHTASGSSTTDAVTTTTAPTTTVPLTATTTTTTTTTPSTAVPPGDVRSQPAGLFCRDLKARGFSYSAAVDYWYANGQPDRMDADRNGIPCETVYAPSDVAARWGGQEPASGPDPGLSCRQIADAGYSYAVAVAYWYYEGLPDRMDADGNGIPCETVYSAADVQAFWG